MTIKKKKYYQTSSNFDKKLLKVYEYRAKRTRLDWCKQVAKILNTKMKEKNFLINDIGCNHFQLYKELKYNKMKLNYKGYDIDQNYIDIGLKYFPELQKKYELKNIELKKPRKCDVSICSAVLEHTNNSEAFLKNILLSTKKIFILRTFLGETEKTSIYNDKKFVKEPYYIKQFSFRYIIKIFNKFKFNTEFYLDNATNKSQALDIYKKSKIVRSAFIIVGTRE